MSATGCCCRLLKEAADDVRYRKRFQLLFGALLSVVGQSMRNELSKQDEFVRILSAIADKVKAAKDKEVSIAHADNDSVSVYLKRWKCRRVCLN